MARRLIPARAGNIVCARFEVCRCAAHPRSRGEHFVFTEPKSGALGSSPLARGTSENRTDNIRNRRLIPARAGNMHASGHDTPPRSAHPRSRGEHSVSLLIEHPSYGSSPLARGTCVAGFSTERQVRLIPARAGNIHSNSCYPSMRTAHPRSRGEHTRLLVPVFLLSGSSPLARGTYRCTQGNNT